MAKFLREMVLPIAAAAMLSGCGLLGSPEAQWEAMVQAQTPQGEAYRTFKKEFPADYEKLRQQVIADARNGVSDAELGVRADNLMRSFVLRDVEHVTRAPTANLVEVAKANRDFIKALRDTNVDQCGRFGVEGLRPGEQTNPRAAEFAHKAFRAQVVATAAGRDRPVTRPPITAADGAQLTAKLRENGVSDSMLTMISQGFPGATPQQKCDGAVAIYEAMATLPPEDSARWFAAVLKDAAKGSAAPGG